MLYIQKGDLGMKASHLHLEICLRSARPPLGMHLRVALARPPLLCAEVCALQCSPLVKQALHGHAQSVVLLDSRHRVLE